MRLTKSVIVMFLISISLFSCSKKNETSFRYDNKNDIITYNDTVYVRYDTHHSMNQWIFDVRNTVHIGYIAGTGMTKYRINIPVGTKNAIPEFLYIALIGEGPCYIRNDLKLSSIYDTEYAEVTVIWSDDNKLSYMNKSGGGIYFDDLINQRKEAVSDLPDKESYGRLHCVHSEYEYLYVEFYILLSKNKYWIEAYDDNDVVIYYPINE